MKLEKRVEELEKEVAGLKQKVDQPLDKEKVIDALSSTLKAELSTYSGFAPEDSNGKCLNVNPVECPKEVAKKVELENILLDILVELKNISEYIDIQKAKELKTINSTHLCAKHGKSQEITFQEVLEASRQCLQE